uniref:Uncharacterized protein n=1 Tax=Arundo donax TaxID=35708 RepID=A0A0A8ZY26_ARUDO
MKRRGKGT